MVNIFSFKPETTFEVIDGGFEGEFDGTGDIVFPGNFFTVLLGSSGEAAEFAEFNISEFSIPPGETITSAKFQVKITGLEVGGLGVPVGDNPDIIGVFGYAGNGVADASDLEKGVLLDAEDTSNPSLGQQLAFDVTNFVKDLVNNGESFAGIGLRALEFGGLLVDPASESMPKLIIKTARITNNAPVANDDTVKSFQKSPITIPITKLLSNDSDSDGDSLTITAVNNAVDGTVTLNHNRDLVIFTPNRNFQGNASFEYTLSDNQGDTDIGLVTVKVCHNIDGTENHDHLQGSDRKDIIWGFGGNDTLNGFGGNDILKGGKGNDNLLGGGGKDTLVAGGGHDFLQGDNGNDQLDGGRGNDGLLGGQDRDILNGGEGNDFLNGGAGVDTLTGGSGADNFFLDGNSLTTDIITDFNLEEGDRITTFNNVVYRDLSFVGNDILFGNIVLATFEGFDTTSLNSSHFYVI